MTWPALGGGGISLPYLEDEADGDVPARYRMYGYLTDREFNEVCSERGIKAFSVIFSMQGWEFPAELSDGEDRVLALNELRGAGKPAWLGLREFTQNTYPKIWKPFESYFPDGLRNSDGEEVTDLWEECCSRACTVRRSVPTGWSAPTGTTCVISWTPTTRCGGSTSRRSSASRSMPASMASSSTSPTARSAPSSTAAASARTA